MYFSYEQQLVISMSVILYKIKILSRSTFRHWIGHQKFLVIIFLQWLNDFRALICLDTILEVREFNVIPCGSLFLCKTYVYVLQCGKTAGFDLGTRQSNYECTFHEMSSRARPLTKHKRWRRGLVKRGRVWLCAGSRRR